ncbi:hypothetical protein [Streptomyces spirodelae]|uniref:Uncharacterized protein n=1 Tax=Streptomyces spirodelae TaxID=2812904 RepID=A0ABS3X2A1_9ACTN|nr:hypothetical protein [Streptomyces spirodelae]MBO8189508.1 hypothetical protein [Streptomyces spirodelae]
MAMWDSEKAVAEATLAVALTPGAPRLVYQGRELPSDRDGFGVLWARCSYSPGVGRPDFASMHPGRQYECMYAMRCQVCRLTTDGWRLNHGDTDIWLPKDDPGLHSVLASKLIRELRKVTPVNPRDLRTAL